MSSANYVVTFLLKEGVSHLSVRTHEEPAREVIAVWAERLDKEKGITDITIRGLDGEFMSVNLNSIVGIVVAEESQMLVPPQASNNKPVGDASLGKKILN